MGRIFAILAVLVAILAGAAFVFKDRLLPILLILSAKPAHSFAETVVPPAPDYADPSSWAALPETPDKADMTPPGEAPNAAPEVDVFFIHPTTYLKRDYWNAPIDEASGKEFVDDRVLPAQASVFNLCCAIYAPRYRQASFGSFFADPADRAAALEIAYGDVARAFDEFLERTNGRPFIIAGHSQGAYHAKRLLTERIAETALARRFVAAYPVGGYFDKAALDAELPGIRLCGGAEETGCYATWNTLGPKGKRYFEGDGAACVNPLNWRADGSYAGFDLNLGAASLAGALEPLPGAADAQCVDGVLRLTELRTEAFDYLPKTLGEDNFHILDYSLYYMNVRKNAADRVAAYLAPHESPETSAPPE
ncbi:MAG: DUF3089 domain-containing protein [Parvularculaceae bacterium]